MTEPRLQHYVPRFYLSGFADPDILRTEKKEVIWVYERGKQPRRSSPKSEARERDFYTYVNNGSRNADVEKRLAYLEQQVAPILARLAKDRRLIADSEKEWLALFIGTMQMRTPSGRYLSEARINPLVTQMMKEAAADPAKFRSFIEDTCELPRDEDFDLEKVRHDLLAGHGEALFARQDLNLLGIIEVGTLVAQVLLEMNWQTIYTDDDSPFLTSDDPVTTFVVNEQTNRLHLRMGVGSPGVNVWFPLCRSLCLRIIREGESG
jgi:hypothetical protein